MDYDKKVTEIDKDELQQYLLKGFKQYALDVSQTVPAEELQNLVKRAYYKLTEDYSNWTVANVKYTLTMALNDDESKYHKLTVKNFFIWLRKAKDVFMRKDRDDMLDQFEQALRVMNKTPEQSEHDSWMWSAVKWKMGNFGAGKRFKRREWAAFPLDYVAECLKKGTDPGTDMI